MTTFIPSIARSVLRGLLLLAFFCPAVRSWAADVTVRSNLNRRISVIGDPVQLEIKISGARHIGNPPEITVDGLEVRYAGQSQGAVMRFENGNFISERNTSLLYQVTPERNGAFTIPSVGIEADGKSYRTEPIALTIQPSSATDDAADPSKIGYAEIVVPKKTAYVGEAIPLELRLYVDARVRWQPVAMPEIDGEGFTKQKMPEPKSEQTERNGRDFDLLRFKTIISPIRAGTITVGPSEILYSARVPHARRGGARSPFDALDDMFNDPFFSATQQLKAKAAAIDLTVKPLPSIGKPADFSGAVGTFQFSSEGSPKQVKAGDPITMKLRVSGRGNFDRVTAPTLTSSAGWRTYPPTSSFKADDQINFSGVKTFEMVVVPETKKTQMPAFNFSYFDPTAEKYVTLASEPAPLTVDGEAPPTPGAPSATPAAGGLAAPPKVPAPERRPDDILGLRYDRDEPLSFAPLWERREFWLAQGVVAVALLLTIGVKLRRRPDAATLQKSALREEKEAIWRRLRRAGLGSVDFLDAAARVAQIDTALVTGRPVAGIDAATVCASGGLSGASAEAIERVFNARAELHYAGAGSGAGDGGDISGPQREQVLAALRELERNHARK